MVRPRVSSGARCAANGITICGTIVAAPRMKLETMRKERLGESATSSSATTITDVIVTISRRRSTASPSGTSSSSPAA
jgi:hypothetical protein